MLLTLYYMTATWLQSWKLRSIYSIINQKLIKNTSYVFYNVREEDGDEIPTSPASSELCSNFNKARIVDLIWHDSLQRGCTVTPIQNIHIAPWISFSRTSNNIPFNFDRTITVDLDDSELICLLLEIDVIPITVQNEIQIEYFGELIAWKIDSHLSILLNSDVSHFCELISLAFMRKQNVINNGLRIIRVQTVNANGTPQPFDLLKNHARRLIGKRNGGMSWEKHVEGLKNMSVLAYQAQEYEMSKNTVKPDLISSENIEISLTKKDTLNLASVPVASIASGSKSPVNNGRRSDRKKSPIKINFSENLKKIEPPPTQLAAPKMQQAKIIKSPIKETMIENNLKSAGPPQTVITSPILPKTTTTEAIAPLSSSSSVANQTKSAKQTVESTKKPVVDVKQTKTSKSHSKENCEKKMLAMEGSVTIPKTQTKVKSPITPIANSTPTTHTSISTSIKSMTTSSTPSTSSSISTSRPKLKRSKGNSIECKPPNILVYSDSLVTRDNVISTLKCVLEKDKYTIYPLTKNQIDEKIWLDNASLLVVCGNVTQSIGTILLEFFLTGGNMLCLCSDLLHIVLPTYRTAEVRENELVRFSYNKWENVKMMHHIFCYQPSPVKKHFSHDSDEIYTISSPSNQSMKKMMCPRSVEVRDAQGIVHNLNVKVLGTEQTWNTPSLLVADNGKNGGKAIFSQVHLETDPSQFECDETKFSVLRENENARLEILADIIHSYLGLAAKVQSPGAGVTDYKSAYFLGRHEHKFELLDGMKPNMAQPNTYDTGKIVLKFIGKGESAPKAGPSFLPILIHLCPEDFSTVDYFENLKSEKIGRLLIYAPIITSTADIITNLKLSHGVAIVARQQSQGKGRNDNQWLSPDGCVMFSIQLHIPLASNLGGRLSLIQHLIAVAVVRALLNIKGCKNLDIRLKWPNDIYANGSIKIGGLIINSLIDGTTAICNIGLGLNLSNSNPTVSVYDLVREHNLLQNENVPLPSYEKVLAGIFSEIENLFNKIQNGTIEQLYDDYYDVWMHSDSEVMIMDKFGAKEEVKIIGIDDYGYLKIQRQGHKPESVHPDGNSFDMLRGLIIPK